jgi:hypothetical protein
MSREQKDVSSYWMTLRKRKDTRDGKRKQQIALFAELALEAVTDLS